MYTMNVLITLAVLNTLTQNLSPMTILPTIWAANDLLLVLLPEDKLDLFTTKTSVQGNGHRDQQKQLILPEVQERYDDDHDDDNDDDEDGDDDDDDGYHVEYCDCHHYDYYLSLNATMMATATTSTTTAATSTTTATIATAGKDE